MSSTPANINRFWADLIVEELVRNGVSRFFIAPGSRSSPLVAAIVQHPATETTVHFDERGTAFMALGYGRATGRAAAWITTSGTAAANGLPAIIESAQSCIPLIALTADRPPELRDTGANQAIDQVRLFGDYPRWFFDLPCPTARIDPAFVLTTIDQATYRASGSPPGPVHVNCSFREPLAPAPVDGELPSVAHNWYLSHDPYTTYRHGVVSQDRASIQELKTQVEGVHGVFVVGELPSIADAQAVSALAARTNWPVLADVTSQMRLGDTGAEVLSHPHFVSAALRDTVVPDVVIRLGGPVSSKEIQQFVDTCNAPVIAVHDQPERRDPGHRVSQVVRCSTEAFCREFQNGASDATWLDRWIAADSRVRSSLAGRLGSPQSLSEPGVAAAVTRLLPEKHALFVASSMPIRDVDMFGSARGALRRIGANRGASGIDGTLATAFGYHLGAQTPVTLLIGDLAMLHDLNSLAVMAGHDMIIVVVNNGGGGIFSFLPIAAYKDVFEPWFTAPHAWSFKQAAGMFGIPYQQPQTMEAFEQGYVDAIGSGGPSLIEIATERQGNKLLHEDLRAHILNAFA